MLDIVFFEEVIENPPQTRIIERPLSKPDKRQQWNIVLNNNKKTFKLKNIENNTYLYVGLEPTDGIPEFSTIDLDKEIMPLSFFARACVKPEIISAPMTIKKIVIIHFKLLFERVTAYPAPTTAPKIMPTERGATNDHSTLFLLWWERAEERAEKNILASDVPIAMSTIMELSKPMP